MTKHKKPNNNSNNELIGRIEHEVGLIVSDALDKKYDYTIDNLIRVLNGKIEQYSADTTESVKEAVVKLLTDYLSKLNVAEIAATPAAAPSDADEESDVDKIIEENRKMAVHMEECVAEQFKKIESKTKKDEVASKMRIIEFYERFMNVYNYYSEKDENFGTEYARLMNYRKYLEKELLKEEITYDTYHVGDKIKDDETEGDLKYLDIVNVNQCDDQEKWFTIKTLKDSYYYKYDGTIIRKQRIIMFGEQDY